MTKRKPKEETKEKPNKTLEQLASLDEEQLATVAKILKGRQNVRQRKVILPFAKKHIKIGVVSDTHMTSVYFNKKCLDYLYHIFKEEGAAYVVNAGDFTDGQSMHRGQENHLRVIGLDKAVELIVNEYPDNGLQTKFIIGNHDYSFYRQNGVDIGKLIAAARKDLEYVGKHELEMGFEGDIQLGRKTMLRLLHPGKGTAKGQSYQPQEFVEGISGHEKPNILLLGHFHKMDYLFTRNVHTFQVGTTEDQSEWMRAKNIQAHVGGLLLDIYMKDSGTVDRIRYKMIRRGW